MKPAILLVVLGTLIIVRFDPAMNDHTLVIQRAFDLMEQGHTVVVDHPQGWNYVATDNVIVTPSADGMIVSGENPQLRLEPVKGEPK